MVISKSDLSSIDKTVELLKKGEIVIIPTDTVYGFSGIVDSVSKTDAKIREIKGRDENKPFIQLISSVDEIFRYTKDKIPIGILEKWPGALTIIVNDIFGGTTAFRCPGDCWLREIIKKVDFPLYSTSVNKSGFPILDTVNDIVKVFENDVSLIIDDGDKKNALASTLIKIEKDNFVVLRQGTVKI